MYSIQLPDGGKTDFYNINWAKQHRKDLQRQYAEGRVPEGVLKGSTAI